MILLGLNAGLGNSDIGNLQKAHLDLKAGWLDYPRMKTGLPRRVPLWAETVAAFSCVICMSLSPVVALCPGPSAAGFSRF